MKRGALTAVYATVAGVLGMWSTPAFAYLGPGAGLSAIGAFVALVLGVILAFFGFLWYPVKRLLRKRTAAGPSPTAPLQPTPASSVEDDA